MITRENTDRIRHCRGALEYRSNVRTAMLGASAHEVSQVDWSGVNPAKRAWLERESAQARQILNSEAVSQGLIFC